MSQTSGNVDVSDTGNTEGAFDGTVLRGGKFIRLFYSDEKMEAESASVKQTSGDGSGQEGQLSEQEFQKRYGAILKTAGIDTNENVLEAQTMSLKE